MKRIHYLLLGLLVSFTIAAVSPTQPPTRIAPGSNVTVVTNGFNSFTISASGGGGSGILTSNGLGTNTTFYSSGTTNRPLRVFGTNGTSEVYVDNDGVLNAANPSNSIAGYLPLAGGTMTGNILMNFPTSLTLGAWGANGAFSTISWGGNDTSDTSIAAKPSQYAYWLFNRRNGHSMYIMEGNVNGPTSFSEFPAGGGFKTYGFGYAWSADYVMAYLKATTTNITLTAQSGGTGSTNLDIKLIPAGTGSVSITVGGAVAKVGGTLFAQTTTNSTVSTDGTEDNLYSITLAANVFSADLQTVIQQEHVSFVSSATAGRKIKKYFGGTNIFDSGSLMLSAGSEFSIATRLTRHSSSVVMATVTVSSTSASTLPYVTATTVTGLTLSNTQILKTTGIPQFSGTGANVGDITNDRVYGQWFPAP